MGRSFDMVESMIVTTGDRENVSWASKDFFLIGEVEERFEYQLWRRTTPSVGGDSYRGTSVVKHVPIVK